MKKSYIVITGFMSLGDTLHVLNTVPANASRLIMIGVLGGLSPTTLNLVEPLTKEFPNLNIDAEGRLRTQEDHLDLNVAIEYLCKALTIFNSP